MGTDTPLSPPETRATAQPAGLTLEQYADAKRLPVEKLRQWGLSTQDGKVRIPYLGIDGRESAVRYRLSLEGAQRFRSRTRSKMTFYGLDRLKDAQAHGFIVVVEGESDAHTLWYHGYPAVGVPGASSFKSEWLPHLDHIPTIYLVIEPDAGGDQMLGWIAKQPAAFTDRVRLVRLAEHKDPSALHVDDPDSFQSRFDAALERAEPWATYEKRQRRTRSEEALKDCEQLATAPDILQELDRSLERSGLVGERPAAYLSYLAITSRVLNQPVNLCVKGLSSSGKSFILKKVIEHFPEDAYVIKTAMSDKSMFFSEEDLRHKVLVVYEWRGVSKDGEYAIESLLSEGHLTYETVAKTADGLKAIVLERPGPTGFITTTTRTRIAGDTENRLFAITISDTSEQTKRVFIEQSIDRPARTEEDWKSWHALQQVIGNSSAAVSVPYKPVLGELAQPVTVRLRRDFPRMLKLVEAHALLHQATRARDDNGAIVATVEDYARVRELAHGLMAEGAHLSVSAETRETVEAVQALHEESNSPSSGVMNREVAKYLTLDKAPTSRRIKRALDGGYLTNLESNPRRPKKLVIGDPLPEAQELLPTAERLEWEGAKADGRHSTELPPGFYGCAVARKSDGLRGVGVDQSF